MTSIPTSARPASSTPATLPDATLPSQAAAPAPQQPPQAPGGASATLSNMARDAHGQHAASPAVADAAAAAALTPAQKLACEQNKALRESLDPADWQEVIFQISKDKNSTGRRDIGLGPNAYDASTDCITIAPGKSKLIDKPLPTANVTAVASPQISQISDTVVHLVNERNATQLDAAQISIYEGNQYLDAYVPWWPKNLKVTKDGAIRVDIIIDDVIEKATGRRMMKGSSQSGVTVGTGVDLGAKKWSTYSDELTKFNRQLQNSGTAEASAIALEDDEFDALLEKIEPYMELKRGLATEKLREAETPLSLTQKEADFLDAQSFDEHMERTIAGYANITRDMRNAIDFRNLSMQEQTVLFSICYHYGGLGNQASQIARAFAAGRPEVALRIMPDNAREHAYLQNYVDTLNQAGHRPRNPAPAAPANPEPR